MSDTRNEKLTTDDIDSKGGTLAIIDTPIRSIGGKFGASLIVCVRLDGGKRDDVTRDWFVRPGTKTWSTLCDIAGQDITEWPKTKLRFVVKSFTPRDSNEARNYVDVEKP